MRKGPNGAVHENSMAVEKLDIRKNVMMTAYPKRILPSVFECLYQPLYRLIAVSFIFADAHEHPLSTRHSSADSLF